MINSIILLTDYKGFFGSKQITNIYRGGMDTVRLCKKFNDYGFKAKVIQIAKLDFKELRSKPSAILYTSSEDHNRLYKSYIEDVVYHIQDSGIIVLPQFNYLRAHNNKVAMELLRERSQYEPIKTIRSRAYGTFQELKKDIDRYTFPVVIKSAAGAMSRGVEKAETPDALLKAAKVISRTRHLGHDIKELLRQIKYRKNYVRESFYRDKFIVQNLIPNLNNDWKVLVYGNRCYALFRGNRDHDFRASGSGKFEFKRELPEGMLDYALAVKEHFNVPHISLDIGFNGEQFHLIEFQFLYFGTTTLEKAPFHFQKVNQNWQINEEYSTLEDVYVESIVDYLAAM